MIMNSIEEEPDREELRTLIFTPTSSVHGSIATPNWEDDDWVPPWFGSDERNIKEAQAFANWTRKIPVRGDR